MSSCNIIKRQWDEAADSWVKFVRSGKNYYYEYLNSPALKLVIGNVQGKKILDIGCGEGCLSRFFAEAGADVTGIDLSESLIKEAKEEEAKLKLGIRYFVADAANPDMLDSESFEIVFCFMTLMDMLDYDGAISEASRVLKTGGRFIVLIEHPCFAANRVLDGKTVSGWRTRKGRDGSKEYLYYWVRDYFRKHSYTCVWKHERLPSSFVTTGFHRTLSDYVNSMSSHGLAVTRLDEPQPMEEGVRLHPPMGKHFRVPQSILIEAKKLANNDSCQ